MRQIVLPETKPALEWINGRVVQKAYQPYREAHAQALFMDALGKWADKYGCGFAGPEWEFRLRPHGEVRRPLVPDVAYLSYARMPYKKQIKGGYPHIGPDAVVEILSPTDLGRDIEEKIRVYFACGTSVVFLVDPIARTVTIHNPAGKSRIGLDDTVSYPSLPKFRFAVRDLFENTAQPARRQHV